MGPSNDLFFWLKQLLVLTAYSSVLIYNFTSEVYCFGDIVFTVDWNPYWYLQCDQDKQEGDVGPQSQIESVVVDGGVADDAANEEGQEVVE